jgi:hypothetical protein
MKKLWFRRKVYGYGWIPSTWQGWTVMGIYAILLAIWISIFIRYLDNINYLTIYLIGVFLLTGTLVFIAWLKGEKPRWSWGK